MPRAGKIEAALNVEQLKEFLGKAMEMPSPTLVALQELAAEYGIVVSLEGARTFKRNVYSAELARLSKAQELALNIASMQEHGAGNTLAQAAGAIVAQETFDLLVSGSGNFEPDQLAELSLIVKRLRDSDQKQVFLNARVKELDLKNAELERKEAERKEKVKALKKRVEKDAKGQRNVSAETLQIFDDLLGIKRVK